MIDESLSLPKRSWASIRKETDYEDYREVDGVWLPFTVKISYLDDNHYGTTRKLTEVKQNVPIDDAKFEMPAAPK